MTSSFEMPIPWFFKITPNEMNTPFFLYFLQILDHSVKNVDQIGSPPARISNTCLIPKPDGCDKVDKKLSK